VAKCWKNEGFYDRTLSRNLIAQLISGGVYATRLLTTRFSKEKTGFFVSVRRTIRERRKL